MDGILCYTLSLRALCTWFRCAIFCSKNLFPFTHSKKPCTFFSMILGSTISIENLFFCATKEYRPSIESAVLYELCITFPVLPCMMLFFHFSYLRSLYRPQASASTCHPSAKRDFNTWLLHNGTLGPRQQDASVRLDAVSEVSLEWLARSLLHIYT